MPQTTASRILSHTVGLAASTGVGMIPLHRLPHAVRTGYIVLPAAFTAGVVLVALQRGVPGAAAERSTAAPGWRVPSLREGAFSLALGGIVAGSAVAGIRLDRGIEDLLRRRGVRAPRVWMGLASGALTLMVTVLDERAPEPSEVDDLEEGVLELLIEADPMTLAPGSPEGTPADEYRPEAEAIAEILHIDDGITTAQLEDVWEQWFDEPLAPLLGQERVTALAAALTALTSPPSGR